MRTTILRKIGGAVMVALPQALLEQAGLQAGSRVRIQAENRRLTIAADPHDTLAELLAASADPQPLSREDRAWVDPPEPGGKSCNRRRPLPRPVRRPLI